jgi:hypothetical protein
MPDHHFHADDAVCSIEDQIAEAQRELEQRERTYPNHVAAKRLKPQHATRRLRLQRAIIRTLEAVRDDQEFPGGAWR